MLLIGVVRPDSSVNGIITMNAKSIACCMVATTRRPEPDAHRRQQEQVSPT